MRESPTRQWMWYNVLLRNPAGSLKPNFRGKISRFRKFFLSLLTWINWDLVHISRFREIRWYVITGNHLIFLFSMKHSNETIRLLLLFTTFLLRKRNCLWIYYYIVSTTTSKTPGIVRSEEVIPFRNRFWFLYYIFRYVGNSFRCVLRYTVNILSDSGCCLHGFSWVYFFIKI